MANLTTNGEVITLIMKAFNADGQLIHPNSKKNIAEANRLLEESDVYGETCNGWDSYNCLLIIANPHTDI